MEREIRGAHRQKSYADTQEKMPEISTEQLTASVRVFVQHCAGNEVVYGESGDITRLVEVQSTGERYLCVDEKSSGNTFAVS